MNQKGQALIVGIGVGLLIAAGLFGVYYLGTLKNTKPQTLNPVISSSGTQLEHTNNSSPANSAAPSSQNSTLTLPVQKINVSLNVDGCEKVANIVPQLAAFVAIPNQFANSVAAFGTQWCGGTPVHIFLGPKDWVGWGSGGTDGNLGIYLYPQGGSSNNGPHISITEAPACVGCILGDAAPFFPEAKSEYEKDFPAPFQILVGLKTQQISPKLVGYSLPDTSDNLEVNGVAYFDNSSGHPYFIQMEATLSPAQHDLAKTILNSFIQKEGLDKK